MKYNKFEIYIADKLDKYPHISQISKSLYKRLSYVIYHKKGFTSELHPKTCIKGILGEKKIILRHSLDTMTNPLGVIIPNIT